MKRSLLSTALIFAILITGTGKAQVITTAAGTGSFGYSGDGGQATSASLTYPIGLTTDASGNVFFCDEYNHRIRKISTTGIITTVAGNGTGGFSGDGGNSLSARLNSPFGITIDASGSLYIADYNNHRVRKVTGGIITTIAGTGLAGYSGDGGAATSAQLKYPTGVAVDPSGNVYIADRDNNCIRKISPSGIITTCAGTPTVAGFSGDGGPANTAQLDSPYAVAVDAAGKLYIADYDNSRIRVVNSGTISTFAGTGALGSGGDGGQAVLATFLTPSGLAVDAAGNVFIVDPNANKVRKVNTSGIITTVAGTGTYGFTGDGGNPTMATFKNPFSVTVDAVGNVYISDPYNMRIRKIDPTIFAAINEISTNVFTNVYPNPNNGMFSVIINDNSKNYELELTNVMGQEVMRNTLIQTKTEISLYEPKGIYFYKIISENKILSKGKIIIE